MLLNTENIVLERLEDKLFQQKGVSISILRLDKIHPIISGNKLFKLHYFLEEAIHSSHKTIVTFGGAYSNHLSATAYACKIAGLRAVGIVRGERPAELSHTLLQCIADGMELKFISRSAYADKEDKTFAKEIENEFGAHMLIPEGGYHSLGAKGASLIMQFLGKNTYSHICTAIGTATTLAGILLGSEVNQQIIGVNILKGIKNLDDKVLAITDSPEVLNRLKILDDYHFGGYAKKDEPLITFMNMLYQQHHLATDFVYTAKMMFGIFDQIKKDAFKPGSNIVCIHTGGLQGNLSLPAGTLFF